MRRFGVTHRSNRLARAQAAENAAERSDGPRRAEGVPGGGEQRLPDPCSARGWRLTVVVEVRGQRLDDVARHLAQTRPPVMAVTEHLPVEEDQQQRIGQYANHRQDHQRLVMTLVHGRVFELTFRREGLEDFRINAPPPSPQIFEQLGRRRH